MGMFYLLSCVILIQGALWMLDDSLSPTGCTYRVLVLCATLGVVALAGEAIRWYSKNAETTKELEEKEKENKELRTLLVANRLKGFADALELSAVKSSCATKDTRLGQFNALIMTYGVSSAAELGEVLKLSKASCRQHALAATVYRGLWRATRTRLSASTAALSKWCDRYSTLEAKYSTLDKKHLLLNRDYKTLNIQHTTLQHDFDRLQSDFARLQSDKAAVDATLLDTQAELSTVLTSLETTQGTLQVTLGKLVKVENEKQQQEAESAELAIHQQQRISTTQAALTAEKATSSHLSSVNSLLQQQVLDLQDASAADAAAAADDAEASAKTITALGIVVQQQARTAAVERFAFLRAIGLKTDHITKLVAFTDHLQTNWSAKQQQMLDQHKAIWDEQQQQQVAVWQERLRYKDEEMALALERKERECSTKLQKQWAECQALVQSTKAKGQKALEAAESGCEYKLRHKDVDCQREIQMCWQEHQDQLKSKDAAYQKLLQEKQQQDKDFRLVKEVADYCLPQIEQLTADLSRAKDEAIALRAQLILKNVQLENLRKSVA